jgi:hypothetical protein
MSLLEKFEDYVSNAENLSRRAAIGKLSRGCAAVIAAFGGFSLFSEPSLAQGGCFSCNPHSVDCCTLCFNDCNNGSTSCPVGYTTYTWICYQKVGSHNCAWVCGECYCSGGGGICSFAYPLCSSGCPCIPGTPSAESMLKVLPVRKAGEKCH